MQMVCTSCAHHLHKVCALSAQLVQIIRSLFALWEKGNKR